MKKIVFFTILLISALSNFGQTEVQSAETEIKAEACGVYKAVLGNEKPLVIADGVYSQKFGKYYVFSRRNPKFTIVHSGTLNNYKKGKIWCDIENSVNFETKPTVIKFDEIQSYLEKSITDKDAQKSFNEKYGTEHYFAFSNVGFNKKRDQALLTMQWQCISLLCTDWFYIVLSKINGEWKVIRKEVIWQT